MLAFADVVHLLLHELTGLRRGRLSFRGVLAGPVRQRPGRAGYYQARALWSGSTYEVRILPTSGSADFVSCARGNALAIVPSDVEALAAGEPVALLLLDNHDDR